MYTISRRTFTFALAAAGSFGALPAFAQDLKELKIGFQKTGLPVIARQQGLIEKALEKDGVKVGWVGVHSRAAAGRGAQCRCRRCRLGRGCTTHLRAVGRFGDRLRRRAARQSGR